MRPQFNYTKILNKQETEKILKELREQFGIQKIPGILIQRGRERLFLFQGSLNQKTIQNLEKTIPIERAGIYFAKIIEDRKSNQIFVRLSIEGTQIMKNQITKNIFTLPNPEAFESWMQGNEISSPPPKELRGFVIMKYKNHYIGCGKASAEKISNFIPKNRRLKNREN
ncbi:hypothetical protein K9L16_00310 [Candidatus Pacearchaeota archaeon]|nr:hypothetical protein [Candidatus Pacearchaeota archaeon]